MSKHTTNHDDCGCKSAEYEQRLAAKDAEIAALKLAAQAADKERGVAFYSHFIGPNETFDCVRLPLTERADSGPAGCMVTVYIKALEAGRC